jgi:uncharacterized protein YukE
MAGVTYSMNYASTEGVIDEMLACRAEVNANIMELNANVDKFTDLWEDDAKKMFEDFKLNWKTQHEDMQLIIDAAEVVLNKHMENIKATEIQNAAGW